MEWRTPPPVGHPFLAFSTIEPTSCQGVPRRFCRLTPAWQLDRQVTESARRDRVQNTINGGARYFNESITQMQLLEFHAWSEEPTIWWCFD